MAAVDGVEMVLALQPSFFICWAPGASSLPPTPFLLRGHLHSLKAKCPGVSLPSPRVTPGLATTPSQGECQADGFRVTRLPSGSGDYPRALPPSVGCQRLRVHVSGPKD